MTLTLLRLLPIIVLCTPALAAGLEESTLVYRAKAPTQNWNGWGLSSPPASSDSSDALAGPLAPERFNLVESAGSKPRIFSGQVEGLQSFEGVEVGLVSLVGVHWVN